jgi:hypothetical protein
VAIDHSQAIVLLVDNAVYGSALALQRPLFEAYLRGIWLLHAASEDQVNAAERDAFPQDINIILRGVEKAGAHQLVGIKKEWWPRLCSLTHTGYHQIVVRLTPEGLGYDYDPTEVGQALAWADGIGLLVVIAFRSLGR